MKNKISLPLLFIALLATVGAAYSQTTTLTISNNSFESPGYGGGYTAVSSNSYFPGWSIVSSNANIYGTFVINTAVQGFTGTAGTGTNAVQFYALGGASGSAYVYQTLNYNFIAGDTYTLSAAAQATAISEIYLSTNSGTSGIVGSTNFQTGNANALTTFTFNFTATAAQAGQAITVGFYVPNFGTGGQGGDAVDNFVLTQTFNAPITTYQWTNTPADSNFSTAANWSGGNAPTNNTALVFGPSTITSLNNDFVNATNASLTFTSNASAYTIGGNTLTLSYGVTNSSTNTLILNLPIAGNGGLTLAGQGTTILNATNSYAGPTTVGSNNTLILTGGLTTNGGISINNSKFVEYTNATIAGPGGITTTGSNAIVRLNGTNTYTGATTIGGGSLTLNGSVSNTAITVSGGSTVTETGSGVISGSQGITVSGSNTVVNLAGNNSFTGALNVNSGSVTLSGNNTNRPGNAGYTTVLSGGVLQLQANPGNTVNGTSYALSAESTANSFAFTGGTLQLLSDSNVTFAGGNGMAIVNAGTTLNFDVDSVTPGVNNQTITFAPNGIASIAETTINAIGSTNGYTLVLPGISAVPGHGLNVSANGADIQFGGLFSASFLNVSGVNNTTVTGSINSGTVAKSGDGTLTLSGTNSYTGSTTVSAGTLLVNGPITASAISVTGGNLAEENNGVIAGTSSLTVTNAGIATLTGPNTYSGGTVVATGGEIDLLGGGTIGTGSLRVAGGVIDLGGETISNTLTMTSGTLQDGTVTNSSRFILGGGTVDAMLQGTNGLTVNGVSNTLILVGPQQITGGVTVSNTATLQGDTTALNGDILNNGNVTFAQSGDGTYTGASNGITGTGSVTINGTANLTLQGDTNGNNSYSGGTVVAGGGLILTQAGSIGSGTLSVQGGTVNLGGATITNGFTASGGTVGNGTLSNNNGYTLQGGTINALLAGSGTLTSAGPGIVILTVANTYSGGTVASGGILDLTNAGTIGTGALTVSGGTVDLGGGTLTNTIASLTSGTIRNGSITNSGNYVFQGGTIAATLQGPGSLTMTGVSNTLILKGAQAYTGGTTVSAGTLQVDTTSLNGDVTDNANLAYAQTTNGTYQGTLNGITGIGSLTINGSATLTLGGDINNNNSYSGGTIVKSGGLILDAAGSIGSGTLSVAGGTVNLNNLTITNAFTSSGGIVTNGTITNDLGYTLQGGTIYANLEGAGTLTMNGSNNTLILSATNTYSGGTVASAGTIALTNGGTIGSGSLTITGGTVDLGGETLTNAFSLASQGTIQNGSITNSGNYIFQGGTIAATLQGPGSLTMNGVSNTLILAGHQAYTGGTFITAGTLQGDSVSLGGSDITDNGNLTFAQTNSGTYNGSANGISGTGSVTINGTGTLTLGGDGSGNNSYSGGTLVTNGGVILSSAGSIGTGTLTVAGGSIDLNGKVITNALVSTGGSISDGKLTNDAGYTLQGGTISAVIAGAGTLTMNGSNNTLTLEGVNTYSGGTVASAGTLGITNGGTLGTGSVLINGAIFDLGAGTYTANNTTITSGTIQNGVLTNSGTYTNLQGGTILATIQGTNGLSYNAVSNNLILAGSNSYSGGTTVGAGTLTLETNTALGAGSLAISGGTVDLGGTTLNDTLLTVSPNGTIQNGFITNATAYDLQYGTYNASLQGTNGLIKDGAGTLVLGGNNSYSGGTILNSGTVAANNGGAFGSGTVTFASNSTVVNGTTNSVTLNNNFVIASNAVATLDSGSAPGATNNPNEIVISGTISGAGTLSLQSETNTEVTLNPGSSNTYTGGTLLNGGKVQFGLTGANDFGSGTITFVTNTTFMRPIGSVNITNATVINAGATAELTNSGGNKTFNYSGNISGAGNIISSADAASVNIVSGSNTYSGGTIAVSGTIQGVTNTSFGTGTITLAGGTVDLNGQTFTNVLAATSGTIQNGKLTNNLGYTLQGGTINAILQGTNGLTKIGSSTLTLGATNTYTGLTTISGGTLAATPATLGKGVVLDNANLTFTQSGTGTYTTTSTNGISGTGSVTMAGSGTLFLNGFGGSGANTYSGGTIAAAGLLIPKSSSSVGSGTLTIAGGTLDLNQYTYTNAFSATSGTVQDGTITNSSQFVLQGGTINAILQGTNGLLMNGVSNTLTLQGEQDYTGGTTVSAGTLVGDSTSIQGDVVNNSTLTFTQDTNGTYTGSSTGISGTGLVTINGTGVLTLGGDTNGNNSYSGGTIVGGTQVTLSNSESLGTGELTTVGGATVDLGGNTITNTYSFTQSTVQDGTISPTDGGNNTIGGNTTIGATIAGIDGVNISPNAVVNFNTPQTYTGPTVLGTNATVNNSGSSFSSSSLTLSHGSTYNFSGSATVPSLPAINGTINPGGSFNTVTINALGSATNTTTGLLSIGNGNLTLGGTTTMLLNNSSFGHPGTPGVNYDSVNGSGKLTNGGTLDIRINSPSPGTYNLFSGFTSYSGDFTAVNLFGTWNPGAFAETGAGVWTYTPAADTNWLLTFSDANGQLVVAVPEPSTWALLGVSLIAGLVIRRKLNRREVNAS